MGRFVLTNSERELMDFIWDHHDPLTVNDILELCTERSWSENYLPIMLGSLKRKGAIVACGMKQYGTQYARKFRPTCSREEYYIQLALNGGVDMNSFAKAAVAMAAKVSVEKRENLIRQLEDILSAFDKENGEEENDG